MYINLFVIKCLLVHLCFFKSIIADNKPFGWFIFFLMLFNMLVGFFSFFVLRYFPTFNVCCITEFEKTCTINYPQKKLK